MSAIRVIKETPVGTAGKRRMIIELEPGVELLPVMKDTHYKLGYPNEEVVGSHILTEAQHVTWCSASQEWVS